MRLTLPLIAIGLVAGSAAHAQDRYSAGGAQLRGPQPAAPAVHAVRAVDPARAPLRLLTWPGKVAAPTSSGPGPFMAAPLAAPPSPPRPEPLVQPARLQPIVAAPRQMASPASGVVIMTPPPARIAPPVEVMAASPAPAATQAADWPQGQAMEPPTDQPVTQTATRSAAPPPFTPGPGAWDGARAQALPTNIYDPAPPAPPAAESTPASIAAQPAQSGGQGGTRGATRGASPGFTASGASAQTTRRPAGSQAYAAAGGGVPTRQYSVHRKYGGTPDPIQMPADFFASEPSPDLAEPPPPVARRLSPDGKTPAQVRAAEAAAKATASK